MKRQAFALIGLSAVVSFLLGVVASGSLPAGLGDGLAVRAPAGQTATFVASTSGPGPTLPLAPSVGVDFASVVARLNGAVVNVDAAARGTEDRPPASRRWARDAGEDPNAPREGSGSGFIIDAAGYVLTNYHVIEGADRVTVTLDDGRALRAEVVGVDPAIDVALLRIAARDPLPVAPLGNSEALRVGEWVCAIGNPLGYVHSVTVGVVSFLGRKIFDPSLDAFIQTDAAISFGNSGGPLIDSRGQVVGINTAISAQAPSIGFAVPISQVIEVLPQLREQGRVARGFIGVGLADATPALQRALHLVPGHGAIVQEVTPDSPADRAGLRAYDLIVGVDGRSVESDEGLIRYISGRPPGALARLEVWRDGTTRGVAVKLEERPLLAARSQKTGPQNVRPVAGRDEPPLGLAVKELDGAAARRLRIPESVAGVLVTDVDLAGPARLAGIRTGQVVLEINRRAVTSMSAYRALVAALKPGEAVAVFVYNPLTDSRALLSIVLDPPS
jgi:serine protease Do